MKGFAKSGMFIGIAAVMTATVFGVTARPAEAHHCDYWRHEMHVRRWEEQRMLNSGYYNRGYYPAYPASYGGGYYNNGYNPYYNNGGLMTRMFGGRMF